MCRHIAPGHTLAHTATIIGMKPINTQAVLTIVSYISIFCSKMKGSAHDGSQRPEWKVNAGRLIGFDRADLTLRQALTFSGRHSHPWNEIRRVMRPVLWAHRTANLVPWCEWGGGVEAHRDGTSLHVHPRTRHSSPTGPHKPSLPYSVEGVVVNVDAPPSLCAGNLPPPTLTIIRGYQFLLVKIERKRD